MNEVTSPLGWISITLADLFQPRNTRVHPKSMPDCQYIGLEHVESHTNKLLATVPAKTMSSSSARFFAGDILYGRMRPYLNKVVQPEFDGLASAEFIVLPKVQGVYSKYMLRFLSSSKFVEFACSQYDGDRPRVKYEQLAKYRLKLPPTEEQRRIVEKVEALLAHLDKAVTSLERIKTKLKRYRASVLQAAVEGRLTAEWRKQNPPSETGAELLERLLKERQAKWEENQLKKYAEQGKTPPRNWKEKYPEPVKPDTSGLPELPEGWVWGTLSQVGFLDRGKSKHRPRNAPELFGGPYPFIQTGEVRIANTFIRSFKQTYSETGLAQSKLWPKNTLCITIAANIAETGILAMSACFPDSIVGYTPCSQDIHVRYIELFLRTIRNRLESFAPATAQKNLNLEVLWQVATPVVPENEQRQIITEVDSRLSVADSTERTVDDTLLRAKQLRQSILKRAFEGRLVPQDPNDEPANVLLERIRAERAAQAATVKPARSQRKAKGHAG